MNDNAANDPRLYAIPDIHGHAKGEHKAFTDERPIPLSARMLFLWFYHACRRGWPRFLMVTDHMNYLTFEDPAAVNLVRRALKLAQAGDLYGAAETASVEVGQAQIVCDGLRRGMRYSIGAEVDNDPRSRPDAQNIVDAMKPDGIIRSVHFLTIDHPVHGPGWNWPFDNPEFSDVYSLVGPAKTWELYMATLLDAVERLPGHIVGHFYVPSIFGHWPDDAVLDAYEDQIVDACEARGMALEINTRFLYRHHSDEEKQKYLAVHRRLLAKCKARNVGIAVGSDAHSPKDQGRAFDTLLALLDECAINELVFPIAGRLARVALRVERKDEARPARESPTPPGTDDRRTLRKARTSEAPVRPKDSAFKRDDSAADAAATARDEPTAAKAKPRPKRSKNRAALTGGEEADAADAAAQVADLVISPAETEIAVAVDSAVLLLAAAEPVVEEQVRADSKLADRLGIEPPETGPVVGDPVIDRRSDEPVGNRPINAETVVDEPIDTLVEEPLAEEPLAEEPLVEEVLAEEPLVDGVELVAAPGDAVAVVEEPIAASSILQDPVGYASIATEPVGEKRKPTGATLLDPQATAAGSDADATTAAAFDAEAADFGSDEEPTGSDEEPTGSDEEPTGSASLNLVTLIEELIDTQSIVAQSIDRATGDEAPIDAQAIDILQLVEDLIDAESLVDEPTNAGSIAAEQADAESLVADLADAGSLIRKLVAAAQGAQEPANLTPSDAQAARPESFAEPTDAQSLVEELIVAESLVEILIDAALLAEPAAADLLPAESSDSTGTEIPPRQPRASTAADSQPRASKPARSKISHPKPARSKSVPIRLADSQTAEAEPIASEPVDAASLQSNSGATAKKSSPAAKAKPAVKKPPKPSTKALKKQTAAKKKTAAKKAAAKSVAAKQAGAKKAGAKKAVRGTAKKTVVKKTAKKTSAKKPAQKRR